MRAADEFLSGKFEEDFILSYRQSISGTQTNMNVNEVLAHRASQLSGRFVHPHHHVNKSQSAIDMFPAAVHLAAWKAMDEIVSFVHFLQLSLMGKAEKILGRREADDWAQALDRDIPPLKEALSLLSEITLGESASEKLVGAENFNIFDFDALIREELAYNTGIPVSLSHDRTQVFSNKNKLRFVHNTVKTLAEDFLEIRQNPTGHFLSSSFPFSPSFSSPSLLRTQVEKTEQMIAFMSGEGKLTLNIYVPELAYNFLQCCHLLADEVSSLYAYCRNAALSVSPCLQEAKF
jgi:fumarate hydratase class II